MFNYLVSISCNSSELELLPGVNSGEIFVILYHCGLLIAVEVIYPHIAAEVIHPHIAAEVIYPHIHQQNISAVTSRGYYLLTQW